MIGLYHQLGVSTNTMFVAGVAGFLACATAVIALLGPLLTAKQERELKRRVATWWVLVGLFGACVFFWPHLLVVFALVMSLLGLREFFSLMPYRQSDRRIYLLAYGAAVLQYVWVAMGWYGMFIVFLPVFGFLLLAQQFTFLERPKGSFAACARVHLGLVLVVFCLSHAAYLLALPGPTGLEAGVGWVCFLVVGTQLNDVAQYCFGKALGRTPVLPVVSPNKTVAGVLGGVGVSVFLALLTGPLLTPMSLGMSALAGLIIGLGGFVGDAVMSGIKREAGVKDASGFLPGHGGVLDRIDSLLFTAPLVFHFARYLYY